MDFNGLSGLLARYTLITVAAACCVLTSAPRSTAAPEIIDCVVDGDQTVVTLGAGPYTIIETPAGQRIEMAQCDDLKIPGRPLLPMKRLLIALPPGARATSVEILSQRTTPLPGTYRIAPCPPIMLLPDMPDWEAGMQRLEAEWQAEHAAAMRSATPLPADPAWLAGRGTLRKYSYATVAYCPFSYHPASGRLEYHHEVELAIRCERPATAGPEAELIDRLMQDRVADGRAAELFANAWQLADLYPAPDPNTPPRDENYDFVIITTAALETPVVASSFTAWKSTRGFSLRTVLTSDVEITGQPGVDLAEQIRNFLRSRYAAWGIEYVLFVGDYATVPMRICYPDPAFHVYNPSDPGLIAPGTPTDHYHADLSYPDAISWDSDGDGYHGEYGEDNPDFLAEVAVGRIPVNDPARITYALDKLVAFEQDDGDWKNNVLHGGSILFFENQNHSGYPFVDGSSCLDSLETGLMNGYDITHFTERAGIVTSYFDWPPISHSSFTTSWRTGQHAIVNWSGHGWCDGAYRTVWEWDDGDGVPEASNGEMASYRFIGTISSNLDDDHPSIVFAISCNVGYPEPNPYGNLGIDLLTKPGWGSSAGMVSSARPAAVSGDWKNNPGGTEQICFDFNRHLVAEGARVGDALYAGKFDAYYVYGWDRVYEYMNLYNFNLFGDPSLEVVQSTTAIADAGEIAAPAISLWPIAPNPSASRTALRFVVTEPGPVRVYVHDVGGRHVATLADGRFDRGEFTVSWDGTGASGRRLGAGVYFLTAQTPEYQTTRKLVLMR